MTKAETLDTHGGKGQFRVYLAASEACSTADRHAAAPSHLVSPHVTTASTSPADTFAATYDEYARFVWRALVRLGVADRDVEDVVQEVFLVVHRRAAEFRQESTMRTWVYGIAVHVARNYRRTGTRRHTGNAALDASAETEALPGDSRACS